MRLDLINVENTSTMTSFEQNFNLPHGRPMDVDIGCPEEVIKTFILALHGT